MATLLQNNAAEAGGPVNSVQTTLTGVTAGNDLLVCIMWQGSASISVSDGNSYTQIGSTYTGSNWYAAAFKYEGATAGDKTITATLSGAYYPRITAFELQDSDGFDGFLAVQQASCPSTTDGVTTGDLTTTVDGDLLIGLTRDVSWSGNTHTPGTGYTEVTLTNGTNENRCESLVQATAGARAATWTNQYSGDTMVSIIVAVKGTTGPTAPTIDVDPVNQTKHVGETATFTCTASSHGGTGLSYQWEENNGVSWSNVGTNSNSYTTGTLNRLMNGYQYRVTVTDSAGTDTSATATLTVQEGIHYWIIG